MVTGACAIEGWKLLGGSSALACLVVVGAAQPLAHGISQRHGSIVSVGYGHGVSRAWAVGGTAAQTVRADSLVPHLRPRAFLLADPLMLMQEL